MEREVITMRKSKSFRLEKLLEQRIKMGDYALVRFPSERKLAAAEGVTQMTARKAIMGLKSRGLLERLPNGTTSPAPSLSGKEGVCALLAPAYASSNTFFWQKILAHEAYGTGWRVKLVLYTHWDDPIIEESVAGFDGIFLYPVSEPLQERASSLLNSGRAPVVCIGEDMSSLGVPSVLVHPEDAAPRMLDYLESLGHRRIDCLNTQPLDPNTIKKIGQWRKWLLVHGLEGELFDNPVESYGHSYEKALGYVTSLLKCLLCTTEGSAIGASRALISHGLLPGRDVSVASCCDEGMAKFFHPSITSMGVPDHSGDIRLCMEWMRREGRRWEGPLLLGSKGGEIFIGESTCAPAGEAGETLKKRLK